MNSYTCYYLIFKHEYVLNYDNEIEVYSNKTDESILFILRRLYEKTCNNSIISFL